MPVIPPHTLHDEWHAARDQGGRRPQWYAPGDGQAVPDAHHLTARPTLGHRHAHPPHPAEPQAMGGGFLPERPGLQVRRASHYFLGKPKTTGESTGLT